MGLSSYLNIWNTCLLVLRQKGYRLQVTGELDQDGSIDPHKCHWIAEKDGFYFCGDNPIELLGLIGLRDFLQPSEDTDYWWRIEGEDVLYELYDKAFPDLASND